jgi:cell wall-associated NlpC family hydrolase
MHIFKNTNSILINCILTTFLVLGLVSCKQTMTMTSSDFETNHTKESKEPSKIEGTHAHTVISTARSYKGTSYKLGGCSKKGIDCSGLTYTAFKSVHIDLPRTADEQSLRAKSLKLHELKPGDLVFFTDKKGHKKITHVGIVTEVKGTKEIKFIHASTHAGVVEENLCTEWYMALFIKGGRIL